MLTDPFPAIDDLEILFESGSDLELMTLRRRAFDEGRAAGFESGRFEGVAQGLAQGVVEGRAEVGAVLAAISSSVDAAHQEDARLGAELLDLALTIAAAVLQREVTLASDSGHDALVRAMTATPGRTSVIAHLNPEDCELLGDVEDVVPGCDITVIADPSIGRGECVLDAGPTRVDARFGPALERVRAVLATPTGHAEDGSS